MQYSFLTIKDISVSASTDNIKVWNLRSVTMHPGGLPVDTFYNPTLVRKKSKVKQRQRRSDSIHMKTLGTGYGQPRNDILIYAPSSPGQPAKETIAHG